MALEKLVDNLTAQPQPPGPIGRERTFISLEDRPDVGVSALQDDETPEEPTPAKKTAPKKTAPKKTSEKKTAAKKTAAKKTAPRPKPET